MPVGSVSRDIFEARAAIIQNPEHMPARVMQQNTVNLRVGRNSAETTDS
jgi:hypothetical protein